MNVRNAITELTAELEVRGITIDLQCCLANSKRMNWKLMVLTADVDLYNRTFVNCHGVEAESSANYPIPPQHRPAAANHENKVYISFTHQISLTHTNRQCGDAAECHRQRMTRMP